MEGQKGGGGGGGETRLPGRERADVWKQTQLVIVLLKIFCLKQSKFMVKSDTPIIAMYK